MLNRYFSVVLIFASTTAWCNAADAVNPLAIQAQVVEKAGWTFTVAPYFWMAGLDGSVAQFGSPVVDIHESFGDILHDFDIGFMSFAEARNGRFSIFNDLQYGRVSSESDTPLGILATSAQLTSKTFSGLLGAGYSIVDNDSLRLDTAVGARLWSVETDLHFEGGILGDTTFSDGDTWVDALAGVRANYNVTPQVYLTGWGMVGAGQADLDWDVAGALGYHINDKVSAIAGYRALGVDYSNDEGFLFDVVQHGPILGVALRF